MSSQEPHQRSRVEVIRDLGTELQQLDVVVLAAGFEDRSFAIVERAAFRAGTFCILIRYVNELPNNRSFFLRHLENARLRFGDENVHVVTLRQNDVPEFVREMSTTLASLPRSARRVGVDISGMPAYVICSVLLLVREHRSKEPQEVLYSAAREYTPSLLEYQDLSKAAGGDEIELVPRSMALEMGENLILDPFAGYRSESGKSCLAVFAGHEAHRTTGVIDAINPALLLLMYGIPGDESLAWRIELSKRLHRKFERGRRTAVASVSTLQVKDSLDLLEEFYHFLVDDYDLVIAPVGSKMQSVAAYMFWEQYGEVQLTFPLPVGYNIDNRPQGTALSYRLIMDPRRALYRL